MANNPNRFDGEPDFVPYFWKRAEAGLADEVDESVYKFTITREDADRYPTLKPGMRLLLASSPQGEVMHQLLAPRKAN